MPIRILLIVCQHKSFNYNDDDELLNIFAQKQVRLFIGRKIAVDLIDFSEKINVVVVVVFCNNRSISSSKVWGSNKREREIRKVFCRSKILSKQFFDLDLSDSGKRQRMRATNFAPCAEACSVGEDFKYHLHSVW